ncbi:hypothetical protein BUALT_Bualt11G0003900 [Buddleja alternifolia]|uniref:DUF8204 domain-containing protein n=1 Tax=Buddleja alternifolia TaxID=168488 RepID=A0AAV6WYQ5_9LAMI|nr:hypothetical protein BUALT_Bualt11G0003900 [Buddleja alternifolia]
MAEMEASARDESITSAINSKSEDSNQLKQIDGSSASSSSSSTKDTKTAKARSCKGCLYYSSAFKSLSRNPLCVGLTRSLPNVPRYIVGQSEMEASKEGRSLTDFRYGCIGYSLYVDRKEQGSNGQETQTELPVCVGLEVLVDRRVNAADSPSAPMTHIHNREGNFPHLC